MRMIMIQVDAETWKTVTQKLRRIAALAETLWQGLVAVIPDYRVYPEAMTADKFLKLLAI